MSIKIRDTDKKFILDWDQTKEFLSLSTYNLTIWNPSISKYDTDLESVKKIGSPDYGNMFDFSSASVTTVSSSGTYYLLNCSTTSLYTRGFTHSNARLTKVGDAYGPIKMEGNLAVSSNNNAEIHAKFFKNGIEIPCSLGSMVMSSGGKGNTIPFHCITDMVDGDYVEVWVSNESSAHNITLENMNIILSELV
jgi:hypothetical protein